MRDAMPPAASATRRVLRERARALARRPAAPAPAGARLEVLRLQHGGRRYAVETRHVAAVFALAGLTPLPCTPPHVLGMVNARGRVLPVLDLACLLGLPARGAVGLDRVVQVRSGALQFGLLADAAVEVAPLPVSDLQPGAAAGAHAGYVLGIAPGGLVVLDLARIAADPRIVVDEEVA